MLIPTGKQVDLVKLTAELAAAGITLPRGLGRSGDELHTYTATGEPIDVPPQVAPILAAHDGTPPPPLDFGVNAEVLDRARVQGYITASNAYLARGNTNTPAQVRDQTDRNTKALLALIKIVRGTNGG